MSHRCRSNSNNPNNNPNNSPEMRIRHTSVSQSITVGGTSSASDPRTFSRFLDLTRRRTLNLRVIGNSWLRLFAFTPSNILAVFGLANIHLPPIHLLRCHRLRGDAHNHNSL